MLDPLDFENRPFVSALSGKRKRAFTILTCENIVHHTWRLFFWGLLFAGLWMLGIPEFFGKTASIVAVIVFFAGFLYLIRQDVFSFRFPSSEKIDRALEKQTGLAQGHISLLTDKLANPKKPKTHDLWDRAQQKILRSLKTLKTPRIHAHLSRKDPSALRFIAVLTFMSGIMVSGHQWEDRILNGLFPVRSFPVLSGEKSTNLWIKPPDYTQMPQIHANGNKVKENLDIPEGSLIRMTIHSPLLSRILTPQFHDGTTKTPMTRLDNGLYTTETTIKPGEFLSITQGLIPRARWHYNFITDTPPEISLDGEETHDVLDNGQIRFPLRVKDDYSVKELHMTMEIDEIVDDRPLGESVTETRLIASGPGVDFKIAPVYDMTWHTWAGLPVTFKYSVEDHKGQITEMESVNLTLPERTFEHPTAKSLIALRKHLAWNYNDSFMKTARNLEILLSAPDFFQNNPVIFLGLRTASSRLYYAEKKRKETRIHAAQEVIKLLWDIAITIEDGNLSLAVRELRDAQRALENAMRDPNADKDEIAILMDNLRQKMANYFAEMQREMQKRMANGENIPTFSADDFEHIISPDALSELMQEIESALRSGDKQKAEELMSQLQRMMEMMDPSMMPQLPKDMQVMREGVNELQELIERQEKLLEQTQKQAKMKWLLDGKRNVQPRSMPTIEEMMKDFGINTLPPAPTQNKSVEQAPKEKQKLVIDTLPNKTEQEALRYILGQLMLDAAEHLDDIPESMGLAEQEMRGSEQALEQNNPDKSIPHQELAIEHLKDSQENLSRQFKTRMQQMVGIGLSGARRYDPLGRPYDQNDDPDVKVPDENQKKRVDEILKTLRDRSGDRSRSDEELDYFRRLLRQF